LTDGGWSTVSAVARIEREARHPEQPPDRGARMHPSIRATRLYSTRPRFRRECRCGVRVARWRRSDHMQVWNGSECRSRSARSFLVGDLCPGRSLDVHELRPTIRRRRRSALA